MNPVRHIDHSILPLHDFPLWADLQKREIDDLLQVVTIRSYKPGEILFAPGDPTQRLFLLQHGRVKTYVYSPQGQMKIMHIFTPGDAFGGLLMGVMDGALPFAEAVGDVVVCSMDEESFKMFMQRCPNTCLGLFRYMSVHHIEDMRRIERLLHSRAIHKVLYTLLDLGDCLGLDDQEQFTIYPYFTHEDIANMIGVKRTTVSELISELRRKGIVIGKGRQITVDRPSALRFIEETA